MKIDWKRIENKFDEIDSATYGLAGFVVIGGGGALLAIGWYCVLATVTYGYVQLFSLITT